jgi:hypothetical protein
VNTNFNPCMRPGGRDGSGAAHRVRNARKKMRLSAKNRRAALTAELRPDYCVGISICEKPMVLTVRKDGVRGGSHCGPCVKLLSNAYTRDGGLYGVPL